MAVSPHAIANAFLELARAQGRRLTNMQVQKLVFLSQGYSLALTGNCIYENNTHAWQWGPVIPRLYKDLQKYGSGFVTENLAAQDDVVPASPESEIIEAVWDVYKDHTGGQLSALTHRPGSPWELQWKRKQFDPIPVEDIKAYYEDLVKA